MLIRPCDIASAPDDPILDIDWPRPDFRAATYEFLIGLVSTACPAESDAQWRRWWSAPPTPDDLAAAFAPCAPAFSLDGEGPRFLQEPGLNGEQTPVAGLFIEQPGANTARNNTDLFQRRGQIETLARSTAAIALYTLQAWAPSGGAGHRTSLRGGGPMTTLALPAEETDRTVWRVLWLNALRLWDDMTEDPPLAEPARTFPWLAPPRLSHKSGVTTFTTDMHPAQCFWGMPRRIALAFEPNTDKRACDVTGRVEDVIVRSYVTATYGVNYSDAPHPLSPAYRIKEGAEWLPLHPQPGGLAWRYWPGFAIGETSKGRSARPAACVTQAARRLRGLKQGEARLWIVGYDMDNAKARGFVDAQRPLFPAGEEGSSLARLAGHLTASATIAADALRAAVKDARQTDKGGDLDTVLETFWVETEDAFWSALRAHGQTEEPWADFFAQEWLPKTLRRATRAGFDRAAPVDGLALDGEVKALERLVRARQRLGFTLAGHGADGKRLFDALNLAPPKPTSNPKKAAARDESPSATAVKKSAAKSKAKRKGAADDVRANA